MLDRQKVTEYKSLRKAGKKEIKVDDDSDQNDDEDEDGAHSDYEPSDEEESKGFPVEGDEETKNSEQQTRNEEAKEEADENE